MEASELLVRLDERLTSMNMSMTEFRDETRKHLIAQDLAIGGLDRFKSRVMGAAAIITIVFSAAATFFTYNHR